MGMERQEAGPACAEPGEAPAGGSDRAPAGSNAAERADGVDTTLPAPIGIRCLSCGSDDLDTTAHPRGDEPVHCRQCGAWHTYLELEIAAVEAVRRERARRSHT
jgi:hypothetical protein